MAKLLTILTLIIALLLFPPAALALISNNAVPGDTTYPIKRGLEDVIFSIASIHPTSKAWFSSARSDRRFKELNILVTKGKQIDQTLDELVEQTQVAASQIAQISNETQKAQLVEKLSQSVQKYDKGLEQLSATSVPAVIPTSTPIPTFTATPHPIPTAQPISTPSPNPMPSPMPTPTPPPLPLSPSPTPPPPPPLPSQCDGIVNPVERARCRLREIGLGLGAASQDISPQDIERRGRDRDKGSDRDERRDGERRDNERENERDNSGRNSDRENNGNRRQGRDD